MGSLSRGGLLIEVVAQAGLTVPLMSPAYSVHYILTLPMLRLLLYKAQGCKDFRKSSKHNHVGNH